MTNIRPSRIFKLKTEIPYNLTHVPEFSRSIVKKVHNKTESISYLKLNEWDVL